jgi:hypothetical protein
MTIFYYLRFETPPQPGGQGHSIYIPQEEGGPVITPGTEFPLQPSKTHRATVEGIGTGLHMGDRLVMAAGHCYIASAWSTENTASNSSSIVVCISYCSSMFWLPLKCVYRAVP